MWGKVSRYLPKLQRRPDWGREHHYHTSYSRIGYDSGEHHAKPIHSGMPTVQGVDGTELIVAHKGTRTSTMPCDCEIRYRIQPKLVGLHLCPERMVFSLPVSGTSGLPKGSATW
jgi:hypothetical protein